MATKRHKIRKSFLRLFVAIPAINPRQRETVIVAETGTKLSLLNWGY
jgi:hypothetical protein